jgi:transglutaminase-like putative cysteine protease
MRPTTLVNGRLVIRLQSLSLIVLWLQLLGLRQSQPVLLVALPLLSLLSSWPPAALQRSKRLWSNGVGLLLAAALVVSSPISERSQWLAILSNLIWLLSGFKVLEACTPAELRRSSLLLLVSIGMAGIYQQDLAPSLLQGAAALLAVGALLALEMGAAPPRGLARQLLVLVAVSLPLMALLFVFGPRTVPYFQFAGAGAQTGLSEELDPGSIASLAQNDAPAMRLQFSDDQPPPASERYWRMLTLSRFDGRRWRTNPGTPQLAAPTPAEAAAQPAALTVLLEPTNIQWLAWGGTGLPLPTEIRRSATGGLWREQPVRSRLLYRLVASTPPGPEPWRQVAPSRQDLAYPLDSNPRLEALGAQWGQLDDPAARVAAAQQWFVEQGFRYTLSPGTLPLTNTLDAFLFERREGFCEHFAAAFTALMRAADVPARVVVGYQGGSWVQPLTGGSPHLSVTQADAHAWSEVWLPGQGWSRVDPTAWVVPERAEQNLYDSLLAAGSSSDLQQLGNSPHWINWLRGQWQALDLGWSVWVMQFDQTRQRELLQQLFGAQASRWQSGLLIAGLAILLWLGLVLVAWLQPQHHDRRRRQLERCLRHAGVSNRPGASLNALIAEAQQKYPHMTNDWQQLADDYLSARFAPGDTAANTPHHWARLQRRIHMRLSQSRRFGQG